MRANPINVMTKIVESGVKSYLKEVTLLDQPFVHDTSKTVAQVLKEAESKAGAPGGAHGFRGATRSARASRRKRATSPPRSPPRPASRADAGAEPWADRSPAIKTI